MNPQIAANGHGQPRLDAANVQSLSQPWTWNIQGPFTGVTNLAPGGWSYSVNTNTVNVPAGAIIGNYLVILQTGPASPGNSYYSYYFFDVVCLTVKVSVTKQSSSLVPGTSPAQYKHTYLVEAEAQGGTAPIIYNWTSSLGTSLSVSGPSGILTVINYNPSSDGITGTVSCNVTDSGVPSCNASDTFSLVNVPDGSNEGNTRVCLPDNASGSKSCSCKNTPGNSTCEDGKQCVPSTGILNAPSGDSTAQRFQNYAGGGANSSAPTIGIARH